MGQSTRHWTGIPKYPIRYHVGTERLRYQNTQASTEATLGGFGRIGYEASICWMPFRYWLLLDQTPAFKGFSDVQQRRPRE